MADGMFVQLKGLEQLKATFESLAKKDADAAVLKALKAGAVIEQAAIAEAAPTKDGTGGILPEGALKADIEIHGRKGSDGFQYVTVGPGKYTQQVSSWVEYGHRLVRGGRSRMTKNGAKGPGKESGNVPSHPFIRPAYEQSREAVSTAIEETLVAEIEAAAAKRK